jgi:hypothetical protein
MLKYRVQAQNPTSKKSTTPKTVHKLHSDCAVSTFSKINQYTRSQQRMFRQYNHTCDEPTRKRENRKLSPTNPYKRTLPMRQSRRILPTSRRKGTLGEQDASKKPQRKLQPTEKCSHTHTLNQCQRVSLSPTTVSRNCAETTVLSTPGPTPDLLARTQVVETRTQDRRNCAKKGIVETPK